MHIVGSHNNCHMVRVGVRVRVRSRVRVRGRGRNSVRVSDKVRG